MHTAPSLTSAYQSSDSLSYRRTGIILPYWGKFVTVRYMPLLSGFDSSVISRHLITISHVRLTTSSFNPSNAPPVFDSRKPYLILEACNRTTTAMHVQHQHLSSRLDHQSRRTRMAFFQTLSRCIPETHQWDNTVRFFVFSYFTICFCRLIILLNIKSLSFKPLHFAFGAGLNMFHVTIPRT